MRGGNLWSFVTCNHGVDFDVSDKESAIYRMITTFCEEIVSTYGICEVIKVSYQGFERIWEDDQQRELVRKILVRIGTNLALYQGLEMRGGVTQYYAALAFFLENFDGNIHTTFIKVDAKLRDLTENLFTDEPLSRDVIKYLSQASSCNCLKRLYEQAKKKPKMGKCKACETKMERSNLLVCGKCKCAHYCR
jgi:hypothetical protein